MNCDSEENKQLCGSMGVQGFPTLKIVKPTKKFGRPIVEDYQGSRESKDIIEAVIAKIPNHVKKIGDKNIAELDTASNTPKAILFTEKGATSALWRAVAIDFLGSIEFIQIRKTEKASCNRFQVTNFPTVMLVGVGAEVSPKLYDGSLKKDGLIEFFSQIAPPNPDPAPAKASKPKSKSIKKPPATKKVESKAKKHFESASSSHAKSELTEAIPTAASKTIIEPNGATPSSGPRAEDIDWAQAQRDAKNPATLSKLTTNEALFEACFLPKFGTCLIAFTRSSDKPDEEATAALQNLAEVSHRYWTKGHKMFPFYNVPDSQTEVHYMRKSLNLEKDVEIIAINRKRGWYRRYTGSDYDLEAMDNFINQIRMGDSEKIDLPGTFLNEKIFGQEQKPLEDIPPEHSNKEPVVTVEGSVVADEVLTATRSVMTEAEALVTETKIGEGTTITPSIASVVAETTTEAADSERTEPNLKKDEL